MATISGHRDWLATECPGGELYAQLPSIRSNVKARMGPATTTSTSTTTTQPTTSTPTSTVPTGIDLCLQGEGIQHVDLQWSGATTASVDVLRDGLVVAGGTVNDGIHTDRIGKGKAVYLYRVCEAASSNCSRDVKVTFT